MAGYYRLKSLLFMTLPFLLVLHCLGVALGVSSHSPLSRVFCRKLKLYFVGTHECQADKPKTFMLQRSLRMLMLMSVLGVCLLLMNSISPGVYDAGGGCVDPLMRTSIAHVRVNIFYQWIFVLVCSAVMCAFAYNVEVLRRYDPKQHAMHVYRCIHHLLYSPDLEATRRALDCWKEKATGSAPVPSTTSNLHVNIQAVRRVSFFFLHMPILSLASAPSIGYVLAQNVPAGDLNFAHSQYHLSVMLSQVVGGTSQSLVILWSSLV